MSTLPPSEPTSLQAEHPKREPWNRKLGFWIILLVIVLGLALVLKHQQSIRRAARQTPPTTVVVRAAHSRDVPVYLSALGSVTPTYSVTVRTQVNGQLLRVLFKEGQMVKAGDLLAEIDSRPFEAQLRQYQGQLARDRAQLANAKIDLQRYQNLWKNDSVSQQTLATQRSLVAQLQGTIQLDEGLIQSTEVNLAYCKITSPFSGRVGLRLVDPGNFIQLSDTTGIAIINMLDPITVIFSLPQDNIPQVVKRIDANNPLVVDALDRQQNKQLASGKLLTIDNQIDPNTGTVKLKAQFANPNNTLFPNQFVNIRLLVKTLQHATVVPTAAVQHLAKGAFVFILNANNTVKEMPVVAGVTVGDDTVITAGVTPGQSVVIEGADKLTDGMTVSLGGKSKERAKP